MLLQGGGLPKSLYMRGIEVEMREANIHAQFDKPVEVRYKGHAVGEMRADLIVADSVVILCAASAETQVEEYSKVRTLLRSLRLDVGLILNFNKNRMDVRRVEAAGKRQKEDEQ